MAMAPWLSGVESAGRFETCRLQRCWFVVVPNVEHGKLKGEGEGVTQQNRGDQKMTLL